MKTPSNGSKITRRQPKNKKLNYQTQDTQHNQVQKKRKEKEKNIMEHNPISRDFHSC